MRIVSARDPALVLDLTLAMNGAGDEGYRGYVDTDKLGVFHPAQGWLPIPPRRPVFYMESIRPFNPSSLAPGAVIPLSGGWRP